MPFLAEGAFVLQRPGGRSVETFELPHRDIPGLWQWRVSLRRAGPGIYFWATRELVYSGEIPGATRRPLQPWVLMVAALWAAIVRPCSSVWKKVIKGFLRREVRDWEDALILAWTVSIESNPGTVVGSEICFTGTNVPLVGAWADRRDWVGDRTALVAHYDSAGGVSAVDRGSWRFLQKAGYRVVLVSTSLSPDEAASIEEIDGWITRPNVGHDFFSWRAALEIWAQPLSRCRFLVLTNTSALIRRSDFLSDMESWVVPVASITGSLQIYPHAESYFWLLHLPSLTWPRLLQFFSGLQAWPEKRQLIHRAEIGFSRFLSQQGLPFRSMYPYETLVAALKNSSHRYVREYLLWTREDPINPSKKLQALLDDLGAPVLKKVGAFS